MPKAATKKDETKGKKKSKKEPGQPKRPAGAYIFFCGEKRPEVKAENPDLSAPDILKELGAMWKELTDEDKKPFYKMAEKDKERFAKEDAAFKKKSKAEKEEEDEEEEADD